MGVFHVTALYGALLAFIGVVLILRVIVVRASTRVSILHGDDMVLAQEIRRHGNFFEHVPLALVLMALVEANGGNDLILHSMGAILVAARIVQPFGLHYDRIMHPLRVLGSVGTLLPMTTFGSIALWQAINAF
ncbi:MAG: MAPEG family protein [Gammaproteobacteria bacterium]|nr:MAPEG family protein [Gammaproteobacteria bacterium]